MEKVLKKRKIRINTVKDFFSAENMAKAFWNNFAV